MWETGLKIITRDLSDKRLRKSVFRVLRENVLCSMATVDHRNRAHNNTAYFCYSRSLDDLEIYFLSDPGSIHAKNLSSNQSMAMTVFRSGQRWGDANRGLQFFGTCAETIGGVAERAEQSYGRRFPLYAKWMGSDKPEEKRLARQLRSYRFYVFLPREVKILDEGEYGAVFVKAVMRRRRAS